MGSPPDKRVGFMRRLINKYRDLSPAERSLFFRAWIFVALIRAGLRLMPFHFLRHWVEHFSRSAGVSCEPDRRGIRQVAWAVEAASRRIPGTTCLPRAMAAHLLLGQRGQPSGLRLGVARKSDGALEAHAWVEVQGRVVIGGGVEGFDRFVPLQRQLS